MTDRVCLVVRKLQVLVTGGRRQTQDAFTKFEENVYDYQEY